MTITPFSGSKRAVIDAIADSMKDHPDQWKVDQYRADHDSGVYVWISNGHDFLTVGKIAANGYSMVPLFGGFNLFGGLFPWRRRLYRLAAELYREANETTDEAIVSALEHSVTE